MIVVDANVIAYALIQGPITGLAMRARSRDQFWVAPSLWRSEIRNTLVKTVRAGVLDVDAAARTAIETEVLIEQTYHVPSAEVIELAVASGRSAYDCEYVALAKALRVPLVTADRRLVSSFPETCIALETFAG